MAIRISRQLKRKIHFRLQQVVDYVIGNGLMQEQNDSASESIIPEEMIAITRRAAAESCVLLKNDGTLPLKQGEKVAVFGRCQLDWFCVGYGSGGDVKAPYLVNLMDGLANAGVSVDTAVAGTYRTWCTNEANAADHGWWGHWPMSHPEMPLQPSLVKNAAKRCETALVVIGRAAGEDRENTLTPGSYYLTDEERKMLNTVTEHFAHTVVLMNIGSIIDFSWAEEYGDKISSLLILWQGGMESGNAAADVLTGAVTPSGRLSDTIARKYENYPSADCFGGLSFNAYEEDIFVGYRYFETFAKEQVLYPFGFGLSYTEFATDSIVFTPKEQGYEITARVTNTGNYPGKHTLMVWCEAPRGELPKSAKVLAAYGKTRTLAPGESQDMTVTFDDRCFASYDDTGITGYPDAFVLECGTYRFLLNEELAGSITLSDTTCVRQCKIACPVKDSFQRMIPVEQEGKTVVGYETVAADKDDLRARILANLPAEIPFTGDLGYKLSDVAAGEVSLDAFIGQLTDEELEGLTRGEGAMQSPLGAAGNAGTFGGVLPSLREKGIPPVTTCDGPSGLRLMRHCTLLPCGTALACTWDDQLIEELFVQVGKEMIRSDADVVLSPGMNIHRNPLCGRNFEYFSEDPLLTGKIAAAVVRGVQSQGKSCCPKHFACNNQEVRRHVNDSRLSRRALREIYLRGFEICVTESHPHTLMTSYNKVNGVWAHYNYDLATTILREDWGFDGLVMTDWWMQSSPSPEFPKLRDNAYRVRAQVDVLMPGNKGHLTKRYVSDGSLLKTLGKPDGITRGELQRTAKTVLTYILGHKEL